MLKMRNPMAPNNPKDVNIPRIITAAMEDASNSVCVLEPSFGILLPS